MSTPKPYYELDYDRQAREVIEDPTTSFWLKEAMQSAIDRDCVDAANDAKILADVLSQRRDVLLSMRAHPQP